MPAPNVHTVFSQASSVVVVLVVVVTVVAVVVAGICPLTHFRNGSLHSRLSSSD